MRDARLAIIVLAGSLWGCAPGGSRVAPTAGSGADAGLAGAASGAPLGSDLGALTVDSIATWKGNAQGAYTIIHDDICDYTIDSLFDIAEPELTLRGLPAAFGAIVSRCQERKLWSKLMQVMSHGHEIINHTWDHKDIVVDAPSLDLEIDQANLVLDANLPGQKTSFFIFPYDSFDDAAVERVGSLGYLGARAGKKGVNAADFPDGLRVMFDVWGGENSIYNLQGDVLKLYVDLAIAQGGWAVREFHGVADSTFWAPTIEDYEAHLDYVKSKVDSGELWVDTPSAVVRYRFSRQYCGLPSPSGDTLGFAAPSPDCDRYGAPLSVLISSSVDAPSLLAQQDGAPLKTKRLGPKQFVVDVNPLGGPATLGGGN
jgi:peptidoglycan/xylan/chitin deacetylase (PgdA/CDA1 family)